MASRLAAVPLPACVTRQPYGERGKRGILISHMERNIVKYQQVINLWGQKTYYRLLGIQL